MDPEALDAVTLILPYYRQPRMLERQLQEWILFPLGFEFIIIDDGSPEPAEEVARDFLSQHDVLLARHLRLYRITVDIPWNRGGARNLGTREARTPWVLHMDTDHVLPAEAAPALLAFVPEAGRWYRFRRWRQGRADFTRKKDKIPPGVAFGEIHPHIDSYLIEAANYWRVGGYDEDYSGMLGGGTAFLRRLEAQAGAPLTAPDPCCLHVYTTDRIADASITTLSRDTSAGKELTRRKQAKPGGGAPVDPLRFPWLRVGL